MSKSSGFASIDLPPAGRSRTPSPRLITRDETRVAGTHRPVRRSLNGIVTSSPNTDEPHLGTSTLGGPESPCGPCTLGPVSTGTLRPDPLVTPTTESVSRHREPSRTHGP